MLHFFSWLMLFVKFDNPFLGGQARMRFVTIKENIMCKVLSLLPLLCHTYTAGRMENLNWLSIPSIISLNRLSVTVYMDWTFADFDRKGTFADCTGFECWCRNLQGRLQYHVILKSVAFDKFFASTCEDRDFLVSTWETKGWILDAFIILYI